MKALKIPALAALALALAAPAFAETAAPPGQVQTLTLGQALAMAESMNRGIATAREYFNTVEGRYLEERARAFPQLTLSGNYILSKAESEEAFGGGQDVTATGATLSVSQALFTWGKIPAAIRVARSGRQLAQDGLGSARQTAVKTVTDAFYDVLLAREFMAIAQENLAQRERHREEARRRHAAGTATDYDVLAAEVAAENARPEAIRAENGVRTAREFLRFAIGMGQAEVDATGSLETAMGAEIPPYPEFEAAYAEALAARPEVARLRHQREIASDLVTIARTGNKPKLDFTGSLGLNRTEVGDVTGDGTDWSAGIVLSWPLFDGFKTDGQVVQAEGDLVNLELAESQLTDSIALEARDAVNAVREAGEIVRALSGTVKQAERLLAMAERGFELGVKTRLEVQDAQLNLSGAKGSLSRARRDYLAARVNLDFVTGKLCVQGCAVPGM